MKRHLILCASLFIIAFISGCEHEQLRAEPIYTSQSEKVNADNIKAHLNFLADDTLRGRDTGSQGYQIAANYVTSYFKQLGLQPMGEETGFEQKINFRQTVLLDNSAQMIIHSAKEPLPLIFKDDFLMSGSSSLTTSYVQAATVFVGYGVIADEFGYNDYKDIDVKDKIVVVLTGRPDDLPSEEGAHIASMREKFTHASKRGAVGLITIHTPKREKVKTFESSSIFAGTPHLTWITKQGLPFDSSAQIQVSAYLSHSKAGSLFQGAERSIDEIFLDDINNIAIKGFPLHAKVTMSNKSRHSNITSPNVIAAIEGSDPQLKDEYVVFSAHLDHIGLSEAHQGGGTANDVINNGALDNASGVSILLETARLLSEMTIAPKRSVLFVVVTAEEKGLLGSSYFTNNPTVPLQRMVANVNLDMPLILYPFADVIAFGSTHSSLENIVKRAAQKVNIALSPDPMPEQALFTRSDHYNFVKAGIPSVFLMTGFNSTDPDVDGGKVFNDFFKNHYHQHSDQIDLPIRYDAAAKFAEVNMMIGLEIANSRHRPTWNKDDFFGQLFAI